MKILEYVDDTGASPFRDWFIKLDTGAAARVVTAISRLELANFSNVKSVGKGVLEFRINYGPGYRIYFGRHGDELVILLAGGSKKRQQVDIENAQRRWENFGSMQKGTA